MDFRVLSPTALPKPRSLVLHDFSAGHMKSQPAYSSRRMEGPGAFGFCPILPHIHDHFAQRKLTETLRTPVIPWSTAHPCGFKKNLKIIKKHPGKAALGEQYATTVQSKELNDPYKKKVFSPPFPAGRRISLAAEPTPWHESHQPGLIIAFQLLQVTPNFFPLYHPARRRAQHCAQVSESISIFLPNKPGQAQLESPWTLEKWRCKDRAKPSWVITRQPPSKES